MPEAINEQMLDEALMVLGIEDPASIVELKFDGGTLGLVRLLRDEDGNVLNRGGNPVYEASTYVLLPPE